MKARVQHGIALIEALLAATLLAIGLLGTIALQARAYSALSDAGMRAEATIAAEQLLGMMSSDLDNLGDYELQAGATPGDRIAAWVAATRARIPGATIKVHVAPVTGTTSNEVDIEIGWQRKAHKAADPNNPEAQYHTHRVTSYIGGAA